MIYDHIPRCKECTGERLHGQSDYKYPVYTQGLCYKHWQIFCEVRAKRVNCNE